MALLAVAAMPGLFRVPARAAQVLGVRVTREQARFLIGMRIVFDAAPARVFAALRDYPAMVRYNPDLRAVRVETTSEPDRVRLFTTVHTCVLLFCKTVRQQQLMTASASADGGGGILQAQLIPQRGAFEGHARWTVEPCRANRSPTCMDVRIVLVPLFWMPPVLGPWLIRRKMQQEAQLTSRGLERIAHGAAALGAAHPGG